MDPHSKEKIFLSVAADLTRFYALMGHALRIVTDRTVRDQMSVEVLEDQFREARKILSPELENNPVVKKKIERDFANTSDILKKYQRSARKSALPSKVKKEAARLQAHALEKTASLSDLVAIFRSL